MTPYQFKDKKNKIWDLKLDLGKTMLVDRSDFSVLTSSPVYLSRYDKDTIMIVLSDTAVMFAVIGVIVREQFPENLGPAPADLKGDELEEHYQSLFVSSIDGECIEPARTAFVEALKDFFPAAKTVLSTCLQRIRQYQEQVSKRLETEVLPMLDKKVNSLIDQEIEALKKTLTETSSPSSELSASPVVSGSE